MIRRITTVTSRLRRATTTIIVLQVLFRIDNRIVSTLNRRDGLRLKKANVTLINNVLLRGNNFLFKWRRGACASSVCFQRARGERAIYPRENVLHDPKGQVLITYSRTINDVTRLSLFMGGGFRGVGGFTGGRQTDSILSPLSGRMGVRVTATRNAYLNVETRVRIDGNTNAINGKTNIHHGDMTMRGLTIDKNSPRLNTVEGGIKISHSNPRPRARTKDAMLARKMNNTTTKNRRLLMTRQLIITIRLSIGKDLKREHTMDETRHLGFVSQHLNCLTTRLRYLDRLAISGHTAMNSDTGAIATRLLRLHKAKTMTKNVLNNNLGKSTLYRHMFLVNRAICLGTRPVNRDNVNNCVSTIKDA